MLSLGLGPTRTRHVSSAHMLCTYTGMYATAYMQTGVLHVYVHGMFTCCVRTPACTLLRTCTSVCNTSTYTACSHVVYVQRHVRYRVHAHRWTTCQRTRHVHMLCTYTGMYAIAYMHIGGQHVNVHGMFTCCVRTPACPLYAYMHIGERHSCNTRYLFMFVCLFLCLCLIVLRFMMCLSICAYLHICRDPF